MSNNYILESEVLVTSKYCEIIESLIDSFGSISIVKVLIFSFLQKKSNYRKINLYRASNKKDLKNKYLSQFSGQFQSFISESEYIFKSIHLLISAGIITKNDSILFSNKKIILKDSSNYEVNAMRTCIKLSDKQILKELTSYV